MNGLRVVLGVIEICVGVALGLGVWRGRDNAPEAIRTGARRDWRLTIAIALVVVGLVQVVQSLVS
ncbi:hypothetical protein CLV35_0445 [Motilibacter peucedani]|uniref:Uncharacterized protein n=1 Tax=Motilibacter peucedani TaxID=598650 RepID=A0A420XTE4_9ACTN|nr:hypothetical protein [Motilibacter peucedani]RKS80027.1 hypothetical protein CLV35_0445 [Motilibacter peucedani]